MTILRATSASLLTAGLLFGCSPVDDSSNSPDAAVDAPDTTAPTILSATPANMSRKASVIAPLVVTFGEAMDAATISAATVKVDREPQRYVPYNVNFEFYPRLGPSEPPVRGAVTYDAETRKLTFTPQQPLAYGTRYRVSLTGLKDVIGNDLTTTISFVTSTNNPVREVQYSGNGASVSYYRTYTYDMNGFQIGRIDWAVGSDSQWFTADDNPNAHLKFNVSDEGRILDEFQMNPGTDARYGTADDVPADRWGFVFEMQNKPKERNYYQPGTDNLLNTSDDVLQYLNVFDTGAQPSGWVFYTNAGTDTMFRTPDDRCNTYWDYFYDTAGNRVRESWKLCATDQLPRTADDAVTYQWVHDYAYDANGYLTQRSWRTGDGTDNIWLNNDDEHSDVQKYTRDDSGNVTLVSTYTLVGTDGLWLTSDDVLTSQIRTTYNANKLRVEDVSYSEDGVDNSWGTPDDVISSYTTYQYDPNGNRTDQKSWSVGADALIRTADDRVTFDVDFDLTH